jgi:hypothetical protein
MTSAASANRKGAHRLASARPKQDRLRKSTSRLLRARLPNGEPDSSSTASLKKNRRAAKMGKGTKSAAHKPQHEQVHDPRDQVGKELGARTGRARGVTRISSARRKSNSPAACV